MDNVFTFWEGPMPAYIKLCMKTWNFPYTVLDYSNVNDYTSLPIEKLKFFTLPQIADIVRVHVLRDNGGYWLDADTIVLGELPQLTVFGRPEIRDVSIGYLHTEKNNPMFVEWAQFQEKHGVRVYLRKEKNNWDTMGNAFINPYLKEHKEVEIGNIINCFPEEYMIEKDISRKEKYFSFYFRNEYQLSDIKETPIIMLHNSWTPRWYKNFTKKQVLDRRLTMSNFLRDVI